MGFDPMTHRPRTDFFATLQQLIAFAKLRELIESRPWDDHAARLQAEASLASKLQCLQQLQQLAAPTAMTSSSGTGTDSLSNLISTDLRTNYLLGSQMGTFCGVPSLTPAQEINALKHVNQLPEVQIDPLCFDQPASNEANQSSILTGFSQGEHSPATPFMSPHSPLPPLIDISFGNLGDASSNCNCEDSGNPPPFWPEFLFEDPFTTDFAWTLRSLPM